MSRGHVVIAGGGVIGLAAAHYLTLRDWQVTIVERDRFGQGCSHANCGYISPSHVLPLAMPGAIGKTLKLMWKKNSPISIRPGLNFRLWGWLRAFARKCNEREMLAGAAALHPMLASSRQLFDELIRTEALACEYETRGCLFVYQDAGELAGYAHVDELQREHFGVGARQLNGEELAAMEPALKPGLAGAWYYECDAHLRPDRLMSTWQAAVVRRGVTVREQCAVQSLVHSGERVTAVVTNAGEIRCDHCIIATGALAPMLERHLGCRVPIQPGKGYSITMPRPAHCPVYPIIFPEVKVAVTPFASGYRLGSTMELAGYDASLNRKRLRALQEGAAKFLHEPVCEPVEEQWFGWRPMTPDGVPLVGRVPAAQNLWLAAGHNMIGLSMAPATGKLLAEMLSGDAPHLDPARYAPTRTM